MPNKILLAICLIMPLCAPAAPIKLGTVDIEIPVPAGYAAVDPVSMKPLANLLNTFVPASNAQFAVFIAEDQIPAAVNGGIPDIKRRFAVQSLKQLIGSFTTQADFDSVKREVKSSVNEMFKQITPAIQEQLNKSLKDDYKMDAGLSLPALAALPAHEETARNMAFSMRTTVEANNREGVRQTTHSTGTTEFVLVRGKLLYLYCFGAETDLAWTREACKGWTDAVIAANPDAAGK